MAALALLEGLAGRIVAADAADPEEAAGAATEFLRVFGLVALGCAWARASAVALPKVDGPESGFYRAKVSTARYFVRHLLPQTEALASSIGAGSRELRDFDDAMF